MTGRRRTTGVTVRRIYDAPAPEDGTRVLVDRLWPRGISKEDARLDEWLKDVTPSSALRTWYHHHPGAFEEFRERYRDELDDPEHSEALTRLRALMEEGPVTLLTAVRDVARSHVPVLLTRLTGEGPSSEKA